MKLRLALATIAAAFALLASPLAFASSDRLVVFISDLHVGAGKNRDGSWKRIEDFRWQPEFEAFLDHVSAQGKASVDLVLVGDVFELWQSPTMTCSSELSAAGCAVPDCHESDTQIGCSQAEAKARLEVVLAQHADFVAAVNKFAVTGSNAVHLIPGNHDAALLFPGVRELLKAKLNAPTVTVLERGYFLSGDGLIYADHGHQFDEVNQFADWPSPFVARNGTDYLRKPWGENMVQQFYNQYEEVFPVIDNLADEKAGVDFAIKEAGIGQSAAAVGKFLRFFVFQQSIKQAQKALGAKGKPAKPAKPTWNYDAIKKYPVGFFIETLNAAPDIQARANEAKDGGLVSFDPAQLSDEEIDVICAGKEKMPDVTRCERSSKSLSAAVGGVLFTDDARRIAYLRTILPKVALKESALPKVYVFGHTHKAAPSTQLTITGLKKGQHEITYANTGAFQRVASEVQLRDILARNPQKSIRSLVPEDLPACYNFVVILPYTDTPSLSLMQWVRSESGSFGAKVGRCLPANAT